MVRPAFRAPSSQEGEAFPAKLGRSAPRDREAVSALIADDFDGLFDMRIRCGAEPQHDTQSRPREGGDP
jgi:hypothetical protein